MEAAGSLETMVPAYQIARRYILKIHNLNIYLPPP
jgi:hypothetical protein